MINISTRRDLVRITLDGGEKRYKACTLEEAKQWKSERRDFTLFDGSLLSSSQIRKIEKASAIEEFDIFIRPTLSITARADYDSIRSSALQSGVDPSLNAILSAMDRKRQDREYSLSVARQPSEEELRRRRATASRALEAWRSRTA